MVRVSNSSELTTAIPKGGLIELESGTYYLNRVVFRTSNTKIVSVNPSKPAVIMMATKHPQYPMLSGNGLRGITFENVIIDGNFANQPGEVRGQSKLVLVFLQNCSGITMRKCTVRNSAADGLKLDGCHDVLVEDCTAYDLGHEFVYAMYNTYGCTFRGNNVKTRVNSAFRISYGGYGYDIYNNTIWSWLDKASTGPGIEIDKRTVRFVEIWNNTFRTLNGAGIWAISDGGTCEDIRIHDNIFDTVGQYYTTGGVFQNWYNGYSNGCLTGAGFDGIVFENNTIRNVKYAVIMNEWDYADRLSGVKYTWTIRNNIIQNAEVGFRIDTPRGTLVGSGNRLSNIKVFSMGRKENVKVNTDDPISNDEDTEETIKATVTVTDAHGRTGTQAMAIKTIPVSPRTLSTVLTTTRIAVDGRYGHANKEVIMGADTKEAENATGTDVLVSVSLIRADGTAGSLSFVMPTAEGTGESIFKLRTPDGRYGEEPLNIILEGGIAEPEPEPEIITAIVSVKNTKGWTGSQTLQIETVQEDPRKYQTTLITTKVTTGGVYGSRNIEFMVDKTSPLTVMEDTVTGTDLLATVELIRPSGESGKVTFRIPTVQASGYNIFKLRTPDGKYGESPLNIAMQQPPEPENRVKRVLYTVIAEVGGTEILHTTHEEDALNPVVVDGETEVTVTTKLKTIGRQEHYGEYTKVIVLSEL